MTDASTTPEVIMLTDNCPELAKLGKYVTYQVDRDHNEAVAAYLRTFNQLPERVYTLRNMCYIEEPE